VRPNDRIPGFAICARCGVRRQLAACRTCGLLVCADCRGTRECAVCHFERLAAERRTQRRARLKELGRRAAVVGLVAASGATGLGAAFLPDGPLCAGAVEPTPVELRMVAPQLAHQVTLDAARPPWAHLHEAGGVSSAAAPGSVRPLALHCVDTSDGVTCCVIAPK